MFVGSDRPIKGDYDTKPITPTTPQKTSTPTKALGTATIAEANKTPEKTPILTESRVTGVLNSANLGFVNVIVSAIVSIVSRILTSIASSKVDDGKKASVSSSKAESLFAKDQLKKLKDIPEAQVMEANLKSDPNLFPITGSDGRKMQIRKEMYKDFNRTFSKDAIVVEVSTPEGPKFCRFIPPVPKTEVGLADAIIKFHDAIVDHMPEETKKSLNANKTDEVNTWFNNVTFLQTQAGWGHQQSIIMYEEYAKGYRAGEFSTEEYDTRHSHITIGEDRIDIHSTNTYELRRLGAKGNDKVEGYFVKELHQSISSTGLCNPNPVTLKDARYYGD